VVVSSDVSSVVSLPVCAAVPAASATVFFANSAIIPMARAMIPSQITTLMTIRRAFFTLPDARDKGSEQQTLHLEVLPSQQDLLYHHKYPKSPSRTSIL
jgi:hypothetical protein